MKHVNFTITEQWELILESRDEILLVKQKRKSSTKIAKKIRDGLKQGMNPKDAEFKCGVLKFFWRLLVCVSPNT